MNADFDVGVVGGGIIGLACAATLSSRGRSVVLLDCHSRPGQETSSRNSGVIHAGLYYPVGSLKARLCVEGRQLLYRRCLSHGVGHRKTGKLLVATAPEEEKKLEAIFARARQNGAGALRPLDRKAILEREPRVSASAGLWSPESGIVDVHELMYSYQKEASDHGTLLAFQTEVEGVERTAHQERRSGGSVLGKGQWWTVDAGTSTIRLLKWEEQSLASSPRSLVSRARIYATSNRAGGW